MLYAVISQDVEDSLEKRLSARPAHVDRLNALKDAGRLVLAGPHPAIDSEDPGAAGFTGSLIVAEFDSLEDQKKCREIINNMVGGNIHAVSLVSDETLKRLLGK